MTFQMISRKKLAGALCVAALVLGAGVALRAQPPMGMGGRWEYLGQANVDGRRDHDLIKVHSRVPFRALQIRVERGAINFNNVIVHYGNGQRIPIDIRQVIPAGGTTRPIPLPGGVRFIRGVEFYYARANFGSARPRVRLFAQR